jgi:hypothetical protein
MVVQREYIDGYSLVDVVFDSEIPANFPLEKLVSSKYTDLFCTKNEFNSVVHPFADYATKTTSEPRTFLAILSAMRSKGWNVVGTDATLTKDPYMMKKTFYLEILYGNNKF